jgi:hypothetical protein
MKFFRLGFIAAMAMALCGQQALAADAPPAAFKMDPKIHEQSMKDAPPLVLAAGLDCQITDAYLLGLSDEKVNGKTYKSSFYELACGQGGLGYIFKSSPGQDNLSFDCLSLKNAAEKAIAAKQKPGNTCQLPANANPAAGLQPLLVKGGVNCASVTKANWVGASPADKLNVYEAACSDGNGYLMTVPAPGSTKTLQVVDCAKSDLIGVTCELTSKEAIAQHIIAVSTGANRPTCMPNKARWVVSDPAKGDDFYEVGCADGTTGFMFETDGKGAFKTAIDCVRATRIAGGCTYMNVNTGSTAEAATYTKLAKQIGYTDCPAVSKYQSYGAENGGPREIVELQCSGTEGAYALVPTGAGQTGEYFNCVRAVGRGLTCHLTSLDATYAKIGKQIAARGKTTCAVSNGRPIGKDDKGQEYVEVACGAQPSLVLTYSRLPQETLIGAVTCDQAPIANACQLKKQ